MRCAGISACDEVSDHLRAAADRVILQLLDAGDSLKLLPERFASYSYARRWRTMPVGNYLVFFRTPEEEARIGHVRHPLMKKADLELITKTLNQAGVSFIVVGGIAVIEHGYGRSTYDVDIVIRLRDNLVIQAFSALAQVGYVPRVPITAAQFANSALRKRLIEEKQMKVLNF